MDYGKGTTVVVTGLVSGNSFASADRRTWRRGSCAGVRPGFGFFEGVSQSSLDRSANRRSTPTTGRCDGPYWPHCPDDLIARREARNPQGSTPSFGWASVEFDYGLGIPRSRHILLARSFDISLCRGTEERRPFAGFPHQEWFPPSRINSQP